MQKFVIFVEKSFKINNKKKKDKKTQKSLSLYR